MSGLITAGSAVRPTRANLPPPQRLIRFYPLLLQQEFQRRCRLIPADYQGWWTYTHAVYNFSMLLPEDWIVEEAATNDPLMKDHLLSLHPKDGSGKENIRLTFRRTGEETLLWPTGVGQGEFIRRGLWRWPGGPVRRVLLVCPGGEVTSIWYHQAEDQPNITLGDLEFGIIFSGGTFTL